MYACLGSAFGPGGARGRTGRHLTPNTPRLWDVDWLKALCTPVAVWSTHDRAGAEFDWAAEAHLFRFDEPPPVGLFRRRVAAALAGHAPVHAKTVEGWAGAGWPG